MRKLLKMDPIIQICMMILIGIGIFTLYSLTLTLIQNRTEFFRSEFVNQLIFVLIGSILFAVIFATPAVYFRFKVVVGAMFLVTSFLLVYVLLFAPEIKGVRRWITLGSSATIQPSEFAKIVTILITASLISLPNTLSEEAKAKMGRYKSFIISNKYNFTALGLCGILVGMIILQPSLSVAIVLMLIITAVFFANVKNKSLTFLSIIAFFLALLASQNLFFGLNIFIRIFLFAIAFALYAFAIFSKNLNELVIFCAAALGITIGAFLMPYIWNHTLHDFQRDRIIAFVNARDEKRNEQVEGFQQEQSKISIGAGQFFGHGFKQISDSRLLSLPEPTTDFIFAIFSFKFGFFGSIIVIFLYLLLIMRIFYLADKMNDRFSSLVLVGTGAMILIQFFSNLGMNLDILPVGGTTLPFMSAGGSSLLSMMAAIAIVQNIVATNNMEKNNYRKQDKVLINGWNA